MALQRVFSADQNLSRVQDNVAKALNAIEQATTRTVTTDASGKPSVSSNQSANPFIGGILITVSLIHGGDNLVPHGLARVPQICIAGVPDVNATIWQAATVQLKDGTGTNQSSNSNYINLQCSADCNVSVWVN